LTDPGFKNCIAVIGEGEEALVNIINVANDSIKNFQNIVLYKHIPNIAIKADDKISIQNFARVNLNDYPSFPIVDVQEVFDEENEYYSLETSRGCPWGNCTFCAIKNQFGVPSNGRKTDWEWKPFPVDAVLSNIKFYAKQGVKIFDVKDSEFFGPIKRIKNVDPFYNTMERVMKFSQGIIEFNKELPKKIKINHISCRVDTIFSEGESEKNNIRLETYKMLKIAGVESIFLGIESGSETQLKRYGKGVTVSENENALKILTNLGFKIEPGFIMFDPLVTLDELKENIDFIERTHLYQNDSHIFGSLRLQSGSPFVNLVSSKGLLLDQTNNSLTYNYNFLHDNVKIIESTFSRYEAITRKLLKFLSKKLRMESYRNDFNLLKGLVDNCSNNFHRNVVLSEYLKVTEQLLDSAKYDIEMCARGSENLNLSREFLEHSRNNLYILKNTGHDIKLNSKNSRFKVLAGIECQAISKINPRCVPQHQYVY
jgi:hypothetical protein